MQKCIRASEESIKAHSLTLAAQNVCCRNCREQSLWGFGGNIFDIAVSWSSKRVVIACSTDTVAHYDEI